MDQVPQLGRLEKVDLRTAWKTEAAEFTPWLAREENIALLAEALGFPELRVESTEVEVGPFRADILCRETGSEGYVLVENQLEPTDHRHLGQLLTYAAGLQAAKVVWITPNFREEHRAALDWLNDITAEGFLFFGVQIELWRIANSPAAPRFDLVVKPNDWAKTVRSTAQADAKSGEHDPKSQVFREIWAELLEYLKANGEPFKVNIERPSGKNWAYVRSPRPELKVVLSLAPRQNRLKLWIMFKDATGRISPASRRLAEFMNSQRSRIESRIPAKLEWFPSNESSWWAETTKTGLSPSLSDGFPWLSRNVPALLDALGEVFADLPPVEAEAGSL